MCETQSKGGTVLSLITRLTREVFRHHSNPWSAWTRLLSVPLVFVPRGVGWVRAALWSIFSSLPQPLMAVPAFFFVEIFGPLLPYGLGFAAGAMIWMVFSELVPDANEEASSNLVAVVITVSVVAMVAFQVLIR